MYIEASLRNENDVAFLQTYLMPAAEYCLDLNYHMFGVSSFSCFVTLIIGFENRYPGFGNSRKLLPFGISHFPVHPKNP